MKKSVLYGLLLLFPLGSAAVTPRPSVLGGATRESIARKATENPWAQQTVEGARQSVDRYVTIHEQDPQWIVSRLQMYWKHHYTTPVLNGGEQVRGEGEAPVPTVRFTGARDWATDHAQPTLEEIRPYMDFNDDQVYLQNITKPGKPWEWVDNGKSAHHIELINVDIMTRAMNSAFLYWLNGEERYAKFAYDILVNYTDGLYYRKPPVTEIDHRNSHLVGITSFEVIHEKIVDPMTLCYDFLHAYLVERGADLERMAVVFQNLADQIILNGVPENNWNIFQARFITYLALALEDDTAYANGKGRQYYLDQILNRNSIRQRSLREVCTTYDSVTGLWNESPGYSVNVTRDMMEIMQLIDGDRQDNILREFSILEKAALANFQYLFPNNRMTAFGDSGYATLPASTLEALVAFYRKYDNPEGEAAITALLNRMIAAGVYDRTQSPSLYKLFKYVDRLDPTASSDRVLRTATFYSPNVNLFIQRNGQDEQSGLMIVNAGTGFNHDHANGINLELYGAGYPLGLDFGAGTSYWTPDHREYYSRSVSHNTVVVDGISSNGRGIHNHDLLASYPEPGDTDPLFGPVTYGINSYIEPVTDALQIRLNSIVRTGPGTGYYVDIFRSGKPSGNDLSHDYFYHNLGQTLTLYDRSGNPLALSPTEELTSANGRLKGYDYFTDKYSIPYADDFRGTFEMKINGRPSVGMNVWMQGYPGRELFAVKGPRSLKAFPTGMLPDRIDTLPVPALVVRQSGEAWNHPFVAVYEPYNSETGPSVTSVEYLSATNNKDLLALVVRSRGGRTDYIFNELNNPFWTAVENYFFAGNFGAAGLVGERLDYLFLGQGHWIGHKSGYGLASHERETTAVLLLDDGITIWTSDPVVLMLPYKNGRTNLVFKDLDGKSGEVTGRMVRSGRKLPTVIEFDLPSLNRATLQYK